MSNVFSCACTVVRDAEVRYAASGTAILNVTVANNVGFGDKQQTLWLQVSLFGKLAEGSLKDYLKKGQLIFTSGVLTQREYKANDGTMKTSLDLNANFINLVGGKREQSGTQNAPQSTTQHNQPQNNGFPDDDPDVPF